VDLVKNELPKLIEITRAKEGCINYDLHQDNENLFIYFTMVKLDILVKLVLICITRAYDRDYHVRFCERLKVKFPLPTRH